MLIFEGIKILVWFLAYVITALLFRKKICLFIHARTHLRACRSFGNRHPLRLFFEFFPKISPFEMLVVFFRPYSLRTLRFVTDRVVILDNCWYRVLLAKVASIARFASCDSALFISLETFLLSSVCIFILLV